MLTVGLTGGIGSGKTTAARFFAQLGVDCIDADEIAHELTQAGTPAFNAMLDYFGDEIRHASGELDRKKIREKIFDNAERKLWLENLLHPLILKTIQERIQTFKSPYGIIVIPLLLEKGPFPFIQRILLIDVPETLQIARVMQRDHLSEAQAKSIIEQQMARMVRLGKVDDVIPNEKDESHLAALVAEMHKKYLSLAEK